MAAVESFFTKFSRYFAWSRPKAGCLSFPRLLNGVSAEAFCSDVLETTGVLLAPSSTFSYGDAHFRVGFGRAGCIPALNRLAKAIDNQELKTIIGKVN